MGLAEVKARFASDFQIREQPRPETLRVEGLACGFPRGCLTEIFGPPSSGRTSLLLSLMAQAAARGEFCALVDAGDVFDPASAAARGVNLQKLLWVRCGGNAEHALKATDLLVQAGGFGVIVMDLGDIAPQSARRISLASWYRLRHAVENTPTVLVAIEREPNAGSSARLAIETRRPGKWPRPSPIGWQADAVWPEYVRVHSRQPAQVPAIR